MYVYTYLLRKTHTHTVHHTRQRSPDRDGIEPCFPCVFLVVCDGGWGSACCLSSSPWPWAACLPCSLMIGPWCSGPATACRPVGPPSLHTAPGSLLQHWVNNVRIPWILIYVSPGNKGMRPKGPCLGTTYCVFYFRPIPYWPLLRDSCKKWDPLWRLWVIAVSS